MERYDSDRERYDTDRVHYDPGPQAEMSLMLHTASSLEVSVFLLFFNIKHTMQFRPRVQINPIKALMKRHAF